MNSQSHSAKATRDKSIKNKIKKLPDAPGVYFFLGTSKRGEGGKKEKKILYIGKATSLRDRVRSYFNGNIEETRSPLISKMLEQFDDIKYVKTDSVLEALVLEANLIKKYQPEANIKEKDDRSFNYVVITKENFPRVLVMRGRELEKFFGATSFENHGKFLLKFSSVRRRRSSRGFSQEDSLKNFPQKDGSESFSVANLFGPFPNGSQLKEAMKIVRKMFPFRDKCEPFQKKPCFNRQIGLCPGVCTGEISQKEYAKTVKNIILFFESKKKPLINKLEKQMKDFAKARKFEEAGKIKKTIFTLNHIQDVALIKDNLENNKSGKVFRIESYDIAHLSGTNVVGVMIVMENGEFKKSDYRKFSAKGGSAFGGKTILGDSGIVNDTKALSEVLSRRLAHQEWQMPDLIVVDGGVAQKKTMEKVLNKNEISIPVVSVVKDEHHKPQNILGDKKWLAYEKEILISNAEAHQFAINYHKLLRRKL